MASISSILSPNLLQQQPGKLFSTHQPQPSKVSPKSRPFLPPISLHLSVSRFRLDAPEPSRKISAFAQEAAVSTAPDPSSDGARKLYVGNIPRTVDNDELHRIVEEHGAVEKVEVMYDKYSGRSRRFGFVIMRTVEDANAAIEKLNGTTIGGREIKVNITEKPLTTVDLSSLPADDSQFIDSPHKAYVGNLAKTVTTETLKNFFAEKGKVLSAKVSRVPGTSKSSGFGFVTFSSEDDVEAAISSLNNALLEGQKIRVNKA
ncbi:30S ribosomal protein 2, chloroplastic [Diospyros lotus]|uniref:30S ribosomal protein 2, chloroplastic n=1 Tax=Diospyros lotus TaxID=55363 RepID=UPI002255535A|nr:30S ribosomal protein 2, chloroplastic [Diospyros lotus]XP_052193318.1 30S ribosomal protein 2, chloroplastic [Diospyros lotus]